MKSNPIFLITATSLIAVGLWGVWTIIGNNNQDTDKKNSDSAFISSNKLEQTTSLSPTQSNNDNINKHIQRVKQWLSQNNSLKAITYVDELYQELDSEQLQSLKQVFYTQALQYSDSGDLKKAQRLLINVSTLFDEVDILDLLSSVSIDLNDWSTALNALLKSSLIESRPEVLSEKLTLLTNVSSKIKNELTAISSFDSIRQLYQKLYDAHPSYAYFQLELAFSYLNLNDTSNAKIAFSAIAYDLDVGAQAQEQLALLNQIEQNERQAQTKAREDLEARQAARNSPDISISLIRAGNSFLVDSSIENKQTRLLLDTGASITALSPELISRLGLSPTGDVIRLSTANGVTESQLYLAKKIKLGRFIIRDLVVAEINLGDSRNFQGLLGTDLLNKVGANYSYLIDNENNSLIFKRKRK